MTYLAWYPPHPGKGSLFPEGPGSALPGRRLCTMWLNLVLVLHARLRCMVDLRARGPVGPAPCPETSTSLLRLPGPLPSLACPETAPPTTAVVPNRHDGLKELFLQNWRLVSVNRSQARFRNPRRQWEPLRVQRASKAQLPRMKQQPPIYTGSLILIVASHYPRWVVMCTQRFAGAGPSFES